MSYCKDATSFPKLKQILDQLLNQDAPSQLIDQPDVDALEKASFAERAKKEYCIESFDMLYENFDDWFNGEGSMKQMIPKAYQIYAAALAYNKVINHYSAFI